MMMYACGKQSSCSATGEDTEPDAERGSCEMPRSRGAGDPRGGGASTGACKRHQREVGQRVHPRTFNDFEILYNELEELAEPQTDRIKQSKDLSEKERLTQLAQLLHKETALLQTIDRLKNTANRENREIRIKKMLELMSAPKTWQMSDGDVAEVHTPFTTRAKELESSTTGSACSC